MSDPVPLSHIAIEVGVDAETLARQHADYVVVDFCDRLALPRPYARDVIAAHHQAQRHIETIRARRQQASAQRHGREVTATRAKLRRRAERQAQMIADGDDNLSALAVMMGHEHTARMDKKARVHAQMARGVSEGYSFGRGISVEEGN